MCVHLQYTCTSTVNFTIVHNGDKIQAEYFRTLSLVTTAEVIGHVDRHNLLWSPAMVWAEFIACSDNCLLCVGTGSVD